MSVNIDDLSPVSLPFTYKGAKYVLREADEPSVIQYRAEQSRALLFGENGEVKTNPHAIHLAQAAQMNLVGASVFPVGEDGTEAETPLGDGIRKWGHRMVEQLFKRLDEISFLSRTPEEAAVKNSPGATADTSA